MAMFVTGEYDAQVCSNTMRNTDIGNIRNAERVTVTADLPKQVNNTCDPLNVNASNVNTVALLRVTTANKSHALFGWKKNQHRAG